MDLPPTPTCHRLPQLATRGISFNFHVFFGVLLLGSLFALPLLLLLRLRLRLLLDVVATVSFVVLPSLHSVFSRGIINIYAWIGDNKHADIPSILHLPPPPPPSPLSALSFPLLFGAIWSICLATSVGMHNKYRKYLAKRNSIRLNDADLIAGHVLVYIIYIYICMYMR